MLETLAWGLTIFNVTATLTIVVWTAVVWGWAILRDDGKFRRD